MPLLRYPIKNLKGTKSLPGSIGTVLFPKTANKISGLENKEVPQYTRLSGVLTVEAAVILPFLACFFVTILFYFRLLQVQLVVSDALNRTGRYLAVYAAGEQGEELLEKTGAVIATSFVAGELRDEPVITRYVKGGLLGISFLQSSFDGDYIELLARCQVKLPVELLGKRTVRLTWHTSCRKWTGWYGDSETDSDDCWVYVTETGKVYHRYSACTYLALSVSMVSYGDLAQLRNKNGEKYYECERCAEKNSNLDKVYITEQGKRYHSDLNCSGIKRTVRMIRLSEAGERRPCSRCGNAGKEGT